MGPLGVPELIFILVLALLIFGPKRLPEIGRTIGRAMGEFRRATSDLKRSLDQELTVEDEPRRPAPVRRQSESRAVARGESGGAERPDRRESAAPEDSDSTESGSSP